MRTLDPVLRLYLALVAFSIVGSLAERALGVDPGPIKPIASAATLLAGFAAVARQAWPKGLWPIIWLFGLGASVELAGVHTGVPFGRYSYTGAWPPSVDLPSGESFPLLLPFAWTMIVGAAMLAMPARWPAVGRVIGAAVLATVVDFVMEPVMVRELGYWVWHDPFGPFIAPVANAAGWMGTSLAGAAAWGRLSPLDRRAPVWVLCGHLALMATIGALGGPLDLARTALIAAALALVLWS
ncbi:MAG: carotenoid biosynthesis protein, partial [Nitrospirae bacterium]|nr:carotenoid biosynthesis protein [Fimbriimonadaceae bacterium]